MFKKVVDTNIFIDRFADPDLFDDIFLSDGQIYLSSVVLMELRAGAHSKQAIKAVDEMYDYFRRVNRIILPTVRDYFQAGDILAKLQSQKGYEIKKCASITNDCLIAASAKTAGAVVYTQNRNDFKVIQDVFDYKAVFV